MSDLPDSTGSGTVSPQIHTPPTPSGVSSGGVSKEHEVLPRSEGALLEEVSSEVELSKELEQVGLQKRSETIELPLDVAQMGVVSHSHAQPIAQSVTIQLPLSDDQIEKGLHAKLSQSIRWFAQWCLYKLQRAHIQLKVVAGKVVRQST